MVEPVVEFVIFKPSTLSELDLCTWITPVALESPKPEFPFTSLTN